jgi:flagellar hook capping protein FlgD
MRILIPRVRWGTFLLVPWLVGTMLAGVARADVNTICTPAQHRIKIRWLFPCSGPPQERGADEGSVEGDPPGTPPPDFNFNIAAYQSDNPDNRVAAAGRCESDGDEFVLVAARGCASAGGDVVAANATSTSQPFAAVGLYSPPDYVSPESMMGVRVTRTVTLGPAPDIVTVTFLGGGLQTGVVTASDQSHATLKLIVYPNDAAALADTAQQSGAGSAFFGAITLDGATGSLLPLQGFSVGDFLVENSGGVFTARPVLSLTKVALVPDANTAAVSMVGDPQTYSQEGVAGVDDNAPKMLRLAPAQPNPFGGNVALGFSLPQSGPVSLEVFDLQGRLVRSWHWDNLPAGDHSVSWDGRTNAGARVGAGALLLRLTAMGKTITQKVMQLR